MTDKDDRSEHASEADTVRSDLVRLRRRAEKIACGKALESSEKLEDLAPEEIKQVLYELRVHQIELEMQNEELRTTQVALDIARMRYFDLYDMAPIGYITVNREGLILEANLTAAGLLGVPRGSLVKQALSRFIHKDDMDSYYLHRKKLFTTSESQVCELRMVSNNSISFWAHLTANLAQESPDVAVCRMMISDITERKQAEAKLQKAMEDIQTLHGILPICMSCKKIRDDDGYWNQVEVYIRDRTDAEFTHGLCPECMKKLYTSLDQDDHGPGPSRPGPKSAPNN